MSKKDKVKEEELENNQEQQVEEKKEKSKKEKAKKLTPEEELQLKYDEVNNKYLRLYSEFDNFRKRTQKEKIDLYKTAGEDVIKSLLPVMDDFERAHKAMEDSEDVKGIKDGVELVHSKLNSTLKQKGLEPIASSIGEKFDIEFHEAITQIPAPSEDLKGKIIDEVEKGYMLNGKVIRYTKVVVGQ